MYKSSKTDTRLGVLFSLIFLGMVTALILLPGYFQSKAQDRRRAQPASPFGKIEAEPIYDIREQKGSEKMDSMATFRQSIGKDASAAANARDDFARGEAILKTRLPNVKIEYNTDLRSPEVISPNVLRSNIEFLTPPSSEKRSEILRGFIKENESLAGVSAQQADELSVVADYTNPDGNLSYAHLEQSIHGVPVFRGEVKAGFTQDGRIIRVINNLAPGMDYDSLSRDFRNPEDAVRSAAGYLGLKEFNIPSSDASSTDLKMVFGTGDWATTAEKMYFPLEPGIAVPAWRVLIWGPGDPHYVIVDAEYGVMLWRKNIQDHQTQSATYQIYGNPASYLDVADSPAPLSPGPVSPVLGTQGVVIPRTNRTLIGNEGPLSFNNNGWITDGINVTDGNATDAGVDRNDPNGVDATLVGIPSRTFDSTWTPPPGAGGMDPLDPQAQRGAVIQMFYVMNKYHDEMYLRGFTEAARNFQHDNFGRNPTGGTANAIAGLDRVSSEGQDNTAGGSSCPTAPCFNNANFSTPADGSRGRMQMYLFNGPTPDHDGTADADIIIHEVTHGTSHRLHGNGAGLGGQGGMMGEGWGDWYAHVMLAEPTDDPNGIYSAGGYATHLLGAGYTSNYYYGIRRFPTAVIGATGGQNNRPFNPLTFGHINSNCDITLGTAATAVSSAFPRSPVIGTSGGCSQVHNAGEIWKSALWEVRGRLVTRLGFTAGTTRALQLVTDGMKLSPISPTFIQGRDAIITAAAAAAFAPEAAADVVDVREGFRLRGMGYSASVQSSSAVTEAFDVPNAIITNAFSVSDSTGDNDGFPEPGENVLLSVSITNTTGVAVTSVNATVVGGGSANYGDIADGQTVVRTIAYAIPAGAACGSVHQVTINATSSIGALTPQTRSFTLGQAVFAAASQNFDSAVVPALPIGWTEVHSGSNPGWATTTVNAVSAPNSVFAAEMDTSGETSLMAQAAITSASATLSFRNRYNTESTWDGTVLEISIGSGAFQDILTAGGSFVSGGYNGLMDGQSPLGSRAAWHGTGGAAGIDTVINLPAAANGQSITLKWRSVHDTSVSGPGTWYDNIQLTGGNFLSSYQCSFVPSVNASVSGRVTDPTGRGVPKATVKLINGGTGIMALSNNFGYFTFPVTTIGVNYTATATSKRYTFASQQINPAANVTNLNFSAIP